MDKRIHGKLSRCKIHCKKSCKSVTKICSTQFSQKKIEEKGEKKNSSSVCVYIKKSQDDDEFKAKSHWDYDVNNIAK